MQQISAKILSDTIEYVCKMLSHFGLNTPTPEEIRRAKINDENDPILINKFILLIYELVLLHLGDFKFKLLKVEKDFDHIGEKLQSIKNFVIYYLYKLECPFLLVIKDKVVLKTSSPRELLLLLGWLIYTTNLFELYNESIFEEVNTFFTKLIVQKQEYEEDLVQVKNPERNNKNDMNDVIAGFKKFKSQYKKLLKLTKYENGLAAEIKKTIETAQGELSFDEFQFLKKKENLFLLAKGFENINKTLDYEIKYMKCREIFWGWLEDAVKMQKNTYISDPDLKFENEVFIKDLKNPIKSPIIPLQKLTKDMEHILKTYEQFKEKLREFNKIWEAERQKLNQKEYSFVYKQFKNEVPFLIEELEQKYPTLDSLKKNSKGISLFFGEISFHLKNTLNESKEENSLEIQKLSTQVLKAKEESSNLQKEIDDILEEYYKVLPEEIKVFPV